MSLLSNDDKENIKKRRGYRCNRDGERHRSKTLEIHHKDRNPHNNVSINLRVLCKDHHDEAHGVDSRGVRERLKALKLSLSDHAQSQE